MILDLTDNGNNKYIHKLRSGVLTCNFLIVPITRIDLLCLNSIWCISDTGDHVHIFHSVSLCDFTLENGRMSGADMTVHVVGIAALDRQDHAAQPAAVDDVAQLVKVLPHPTPFAWCWNLKQYCYIKNHYFFHLKHIRHYMTQKTI